MQPNLLQWYSGICHSVDLNCCIWRGLTYSSSILFPRWSWQHWKKYWGFTSRAKTSKTVSSPTNRSTSFHRGIFPHATAVYSPKSEKRKPAVILLCSRRLSWAAAALEPPWTGLSCTHSKSEACSRNTNPSCLTISNFHPRVRALPPQIMLSAANTSDWEMTSYLHVAPSCSSMRKQEPSSIDTQQLN